MTMKISFSTFFSESVLPSLASCKIITFLLKWCMNWAPVCEHGFLHLEEHEIYLCHDRAGWRSLCTSSYWLPQRTNRREDAHTSCLSSHLCSHISHTGTVRSLQNQWRMENKLWLFSGDQHSNLLLTTQGFIILYESLFAVSEYVIKKSHTHTMNFI